MAFPPVKPEPLPQRPESQGCPPDVALIQFRWGTGRTQGPQAPEIQVSSRGRGRGAPEPQVSTPDGSALRSLGRFLPPLGKNQSKR